VTSLEITRNIAIAQLEDVTLNPGNAILSVYNGRLLAGQKGDTKLFVYSADSGAYMHTINLPFKYLGSTVYDAVWTRTGNIVYTTRSSSSSYNHTVEVMALNGTLIRPSSTDMSWPQYLSVSADGTIYLANGRNGVYQSVDNGLTWSHKFNISSSHYCYQTVNIQNTQSPADEDFWTVTSGNYWYAGIYSVNRNNTALKPIYRGVGNAESFFLPYKLEYDGHETIFLLEYKQRIVHALSSVTRAYNRQLLTSQYFSAVNNHPNPVSLSVDVTRDNELYVGLAEHGLVSVFTLQYQ
jgi:hypothetical protein